MIMIVEGRDERYVGKPVGATPTLRGAVPNTPNELGRKPQEPVCDCPAAGGYDSPDGERIE